ncbi:MAG TPA: hopanoid-associated sugar epimerase [Rhodanobacteraceae bacterium]|nr:hopanoid-associated sugar epimerase [Rhodanobacteraceae bacterium]
MPDLSARVLVTGATGFIGSAVVRNLLHAGYRVRALVRPTSRLDSLEGLDVETATGDVRDLPSLLDAMQGCGGVFHVAADYRLWTPDADAMYACNVEGSRHVLEAARQVGVKRIVYTSSVATLGLHADGTPADEDTPVMLEQMIGHYKRSKFLAEQVVGDMARELSLDVVTVHPAAPVGPRDIKPTPTGRMVLDAARGRMPGYVDTGLDIVHVDDVAEGHRLAYERGARGRHYILGGENLSLRDILVQVADITGRRRPWLRLPHAVVLPVAHVAEAWAGVSGREPSVTVAGARLARKHMYFSHQRAADELDYRPRPAHEALVDAVQWFAQNGYFRARQA